MVGGGLSVLRYIYVGVSNGALRSLYLPSRCVMNKIIPGWSLLEKLLSLWPCFLYFGQEEPNNSLK